MQTIMFFVAKLFKKWRLAAIKNSTVHPTAKIESGTSFHSSVMGAHSFCGYDCEIHLADIGSFTSIANGVVLGGARHPMEWVAMSPVFYAGRDSVKEKFSRHKLDRPAPVRIGHDVWIGRSAIVLPGVTVGDGAVIGAGAVVTKSVPPYGVAVGNPARIVRYRFDEETVNKLLAMQWWSWSEERLRRLAPYFNEIDNFFEIIATESNQRA